MEVWQPVNAIPPSTQKIILFGLLAPP